MDTYADSPELSYLDAMYRTHGHVEFTLICSRDAASASLFLGWEDYDKLLRQPTFNRCLGNWLVQAFDWPRPMFKASSSVHVLITEVGRTLRGYMR